MKKAIFDTNIYIEWLNHGRHEALLTGGATVRYLSSVVHMELRAAATTIAGRRALARLVSGYERRQRMIAPPPGVFERAGVALQTLRAKGREVRRASLVNDVLIALTARAIGATVFTADGCDYEAIRAVAKFSLQVVH